MKGVYERLRTCVLEVRRKYSSLFNLSQGVFDGLGKSVVIRVEDEDSEQLSGLATRRNRTGCWSASTPRAESR